MILVTAAYGHQGKLLVPKLAAAGFKVRAACASPGRKEALKALGAAEVIVGDLRDPTHYRKAVDGVDSVYHINPAGLEGETQLGLTMIEACRDAGVRHVVMSSVYHSTIDIIQHIYKRDIEVALIESGLNFTILKPCDFMMPEVFIAAVMRFGAFGVYGTGDRCPLRHSFIAMEDLTDVAVKVLGEGSKHYYASYELAGPDKLDSYAVANILSRVMGRDIQIVVKPTAELCKLIWGVEEVTDENRAAMELLLSALKWYSKYEFVGNPNVLEWLLGRPAIRFEDFARKAYAEFIANAAQEGK
jgi:uncharacterized protein YbjT (DUF2867 family)